MKNEKGLTLVEVVIAVMLTGVIATVFFKTAALGYTNIVSSEKYTVDSFKVQEDMENKINEMKQKDVNLSDPNTDEVTIFGKKVQGHIVDFEIKKESEDPHGRYIAFIPKIDIEYEVPEITSDLDLRITNPGYSGVKRLSIFEYENEKDLGKIKVMTNLNFRSAKENQLTIDHKPIYLMSAYRWYISPKVNTTDPTQPRYVENPGEKDEANEFIEDNLNNLIILKEWNSARIKQPYTEKEGSVNLSIVPNIEEKYNEFQIGELQFKDEITDNYDHKKSAEFFSGKYIVYSATPYSLLGKMGVEKFSNPIYIEAIENENDDDDDDDDDDD